MANKNPRPPAAQRFEEQINHLKNEVRRFLLALQQLHTKAQNANLGGNVDTLRGQLENGDIEQAGQDFQRARMDTPYHLRLALDIATRLLQVTEFVSPEVLAGGVFNKTELKTLEPELNQCSERWDLVLKAFNAVYPEVNFVSPSQPASPASSHVPPVTPKSVQVGIGKVMLSWAPVDKGTGVKSYVISFWEGSDTSVPPSTLLTDEDSTSASVSGLANGGQYTFAISAENAYGDEGARTLFEVQPGVTLVTMPNVPWKPMIDSVVPGIRQAKVTWQPKAPNDNPPDPGYPTDNYLISYSVNSVTNLAIVTGNMLTANLTGLADGGQYDFTIVAVNKVGQSAPSDLVTTILPDVPHAPTVTQLDPGDHQVTVHWATSTLDDAKTITAYTIRYWNDADSIIYSVSIAVDPTKGANKFTRPIKGITDGVTYTFTAAAVSGVGEGPPSDPNNPHASISLVLVPGDTIQNLDQQLKKLIGDGKTTIDPTLFGKFLTDAKKQIDSLKQSDITDEIVIRTFVGDLVAAIEQLDLQTSPTQTYDQRQSNLAVTIEIHQQFEAVVNKLASLVTTPLEFAFASLS